MTTLEDHQVQLNLLTSIAERQQTLLEQIQRDGEKTRRIRGMEATRGLSVGLESVTSSQHHVYQTPSSASRASRSKSSHIRMNAAAWPASPISKSLACPTGRGTLPLLMSQIPVCQRGCHSLL